MNKKYLSFLLISALLIANEAKDVEIYAKEVQQEGNITYINSPVIISYDNKILIANQAKYLIDKKQIILEDNVIFFDEFGRRINAKKLDINLDNNNIKFKNFFEIDKDDIWIFALKADKKNNLIKLNNAIFSSCEIENPDWSIEFKKAVYDLKAKDLKLKDAVIKIKDFPIFYTPYFYLPLAKERKTGFLIPYFSYNKNDGFLYTQPFFWAIDKSRDLEIVSNIRTKRGYGLYLTYRVADTKYSFGKIRVGYFKDKSSFTKEHNLEYFKHYGIELYYKNNKVITSLANKGFENKLYINTIYFNNKDYIQLQPYDRFKHHKLGQFYESRVNYYIKGDNFYSAIYLKYFKDTTKSSNKETMQILPKLHFHIPVKNLIYNNLSYSFDTSLTNYTRVSGSKALKLKAKLPIIVHFSLFSGYLSLNITNELEATGYDFYNVPIEQKKYSSTVLNSKIELSSELVRQYKTGLHIAFFSAVYTKSNIISENWMKYDDIPQDLKLNFVDDIPYDSKLTFRTHQYWKSKNLNIDYILESNYSPSSNKFIDLYQEIDLKYKHFSFYSKFGYSFLHKETTEIYNQIGYDNKKYGLWLGYLWKKDPLSLETITREIEFKGYYNYSNNLKFNAKILYNIKDKHLKNWESGIFYKRKCWSLNVAVGQDIVPVIKEDGSSGSIKNNYIKFYVSILPFGIGFKR